MLAFLAHFPALIANNFGILAHFQVLIVDNFSTLLGINCVHVWYFFGIRHETLDRRWRQEMETGDVRQET